MNQADTRDWLGLRLHALKSFDLNHDDKINATELEEAVATARDWQAHARDLRAARWSTDEGPPGIDGATWPELVAHCADRPLTPVRWADEKRRLPFGVLLRATRPELSPLWDEAIPVRLMTIAPEAGMTTQAMGLVHAEERSSARALTDGMGSGGEEARLAWLSELRLLERIAEQALRQAARLRGARLVCGIGRQSGPVGRSFHVALIGTACA